MDIFFRSEEVIIKVLPLLFVNDETLYRNIKKIISILLSDFYHHASVLKLLGLEKEVYKVSLSKVFTLNTQNEGKRTIILFSS